MRGAPHRGWDRKGSFDPFLFYARDLCLATSSSSSLKLGCCFCSFHGLYWWLLYWSLCGRPLTLYFSLWPASNLSSFGQRAECECHITRLSVNMQRRLAPSNLSEKLWEVDGEVCGGARSPHWGHCPPFKGSSGSLVMHGPEMPGSSGAESRAGGRTIWERNVSADLRTEIYVPLQIWMAASDTTQTRCPGRLPLTGYQKGLNVFLT